jgi:hypothetical protein
MFVQHALAGEAGFCCRARIFRLGLWQEGSLGVNFLLDKIFGNEYIWGTFGGIEVS